MRPGMLPGKSKKMDQSRLVGMLSKRRRATLSTMEMLISQSQHKLSIWVIQKQTHGL